MPCVLLDMTIPHPDIGETLARELQALYAELDEAMQFHWEWSAALWSAVPCESSLLQKIAAQALPFEFRGKKTQLPCAVPELTSSR